MNCCIQSSITTACCERPLLSPKIIWAYYSSEQEDFRVTYVTRPFEIGQWQWPKAGSQGSCRLPKTHSPLYYRFAERCMTANVIWTYDHRIARIKFNYINSHVRRPSHPTSNVTNATSRMKVYSTLWGYQNQTWVVCMTPLCYPLLYCPHKISGFVILNDR